MASWCQCDCLEYRGQFRVVNTLLPFSIAAHISPCVVRQTRKSRLRYDANQISYRGTGQVDQADAQMGGEEEAGPGPGPEPGPGGSWTSHPSNTGSRLEPAQRPWQELELNHVPTSQLVVPRCPRLHTTPNPKPGPAGVTAPHPRGTLGCPACCRLQVAHLQQLTLSPMA